MTKNWKYNKVQVKEGFKGEQIIHQESGAYVGKVYSGSAEILTDITVSLAENSDDINELLDNL